jgi:hypothetical protein
MKTARQIAVDHLKYRHFPLAQSLEIDYNNVGTLK